MKALQVTHESEAPPESRRERQKADRRRRIYEAAMSLFGEKGFEQTTVQEITDRADVGKGTFFNYFPSKDAILLYYQEQLLEELTRAVEAFPGESPAEKLRYLFSYSVSQCRREGRLFISLLRECFSRPVLIEADKQTQTDITERINELIGAAVAAGDFRKDLDIELASQLVADIWVATWIDWGFFERPYDIGEVFERKLDYLFAAFRATGTIAHGK